MKVQPLGDRILVQLMENGKTPGGIIIPENAQLKMRQAIVKEVGPGKYEGGQQVPMTIHPGDCILIGQIPGNMVTVEGKELLMIHAADVSAIIK